MWFGVRARRYAISTSRRGQSSLHADDDSRSSVTGWIREALFGLDVTFGKAATSWNAGHEFRAERASLPRTEVPLQTTDIVRKHLLY